MGQISTKLRKRFTNILSQQVVEIQDLYNASKMSEEDMKSIKQPEDLGHDYHPFHALYTSAQNFLSVLVEKLTCFSEMDTFSKIVLKAEDRYMPSYPPMSPITQSLYTFWSMCDLRIGINKETIGTIVCDLSDILQVQPHMLELIKKLQDSRLGIYVHNGCHDDGTIKLYEIYTHKEYRCHSCNNYPGEKGEIWLVRLVPPPVGTSDLHITITTPYIIDATTQKDWEEYFERVIPKIGIDPPILAYNELMKYGLIPEYWNEYVFQAYSNYTNIIIYLCGIPDKPESLPQFEPDSSCIDLSKIKTREEKKKAERKFRKKLKKRK